jgi:hypothetical protein
MENATESDVDRLCRRGIEKLITFSMEHFQSKSGSPIETLFIEQFAMEAMDSRGLLTASGEHYNVDPPADMTATDRDTIYRGFFSSYSNQCVYVYPQADTFGRRADFIMAFNPSKRIAIVECDGYEWHSSKEQFSKDRAFDRAVIAGFDGRAPVFRFSGSQINKDARKCAKEVLEYLVGKERGGNVEKDSRQGEPQ